MARIRTMQKHRKSPDVNHQFLRNVYPTIGFKPVQTLPALPERKWGEFIFVVRAKWNPKIRGSLPLNASLGINKGGVVAFMLHLWASQRHLVSHCWRQDAKLDGHWVWSAGLFFQTKFPRVPWRRGVLMVKVMYVCSVVVVLRNISHQSAHKLLSKTNWLFQTNAGKLWRGVTFVFSWDPYKQKD